MQYLEFKIITAFPGLLECYFNDSILRRAIKKEILHLEFVDPREFTSDKHRTIDDKPYGGGPGMVYMLDPIVKALEKAKQTARFEVVKTVLFDPKGPIVTQDFLQGLAQKLPDTTFILIAPRYEGIDARIKEFVDYTISIGPYILTGAELAAGVFVDALARLVPGVLGNTESAAQETGFFVKNSDLYITTEPDVYTRPAEYKGLKVPEVLLSGNHKEVEKWKAQAVKTHKAEFLTQNDV